MTPNHFLPERMPLSPHYATVVAMESITSAVLRSLIGYFFTVSASTGSNDETLRSISFYDMNYSGVKLNVLKCLLYYRKRAVNRRASVFNKGYLLLFLVFIFQTSYYIEPLRNT